VRGFLALASLAPSEDVAILMRTYAAEAQVSLDALRQLRTEYCTIVNSVV